MESSSIELRRRVNAVRLRLEALLAIAPPHVSPRERRILRAAQRKLAELRRQLVFGWEGLSENAEARLRSWVA